MKFTLLSLLACTSFLTLSGCDNETEKLNARKRTDSAVVTGFSYAGIVDNATGSVTDCPSGATGNLDIDFTANTFSYSLPPGLNSFLNLNSRFVLEAGTLNLNAATRSFAAFYTFLDPANDFDSGACSDGGGYSQVVELSINGTTSADSLFVSDATSTISMRCNTAGQVRSLCLGSFTGFSSGFNQ